MRWRALFLFTALTFVSASFSRAQTPSDRLLSQLRPQGYVTDFTGSLSQAQRDRLQRLLAELEQKTGAEIAVVTLRSLEGGELNDFANRLFKNWGIGKKGANNGVLLLAVLGDRKVRIEVGYGLEPILPDAKTGRILDDHVLPQFRRGQVGEGLVQGASELARVIAADRGVALGAAPAPTPRPARRGPPGFGGLLCPLFLFLIFMLVFRRNPLLALLLAGNMTRRRRSGRSSFGGFGGSGGFGGGFGGFGGGMSGGGGASRSW